MFDALSDKLKEVVKKVSGQSKLTESNMQEVLREVKLALLEADVNYKVTKDFVNRIKEKALGTQVIMGVNARQQFIKLIHDELVEVLGGQNSSLNPKNSLKQSVIMLIGLQGAGKTTFAAKLAKLQKKENEKVLLIGADVYRPGAKKQLEVLSNQIGVDFYTQFESTNAIDIVKKGLDIATEKKYSTLIIDTAGRLHIDDILMKELEDLKVILNPTDILLVVDGMTGQDAVNVAKSFNETLGIDGVVLTKLDGDTRGGAALSIKEVSNKAIKYISEGEKLDEVSKFYPDRLASRILGMGDVVSLVEKAKEAIDEKDAKLMEEKFRKNQFDFEDFLKQFKMVKKMGSLAGILKLIPGLNLGNFDMSLAENEMKKVEAIIYSMTLEERRNPQLLKVFSRKNRIAKGSGVEITDVNKLLKQYESMKKMVKMFNSGTIPGFGRIPR